eukprot:522717_1
MSNENTTIAKAISVITNIICFIGVTIITIHTARNLWKNKNIKKQISYTSFIMFFSTLLQLLWRTIMLSKLNISNQPCHVNQVGLIFTFIFIKLSYYLFLTYRVEISFSESYLSTNRIALKIYRAVIIIGTSAFGIWNIFSISVTTEIWIPFWGYYCEITYPKILVLSFGGFDFIISMIMVYLFVSKLYKFSKTGNARMDGKFSQSVLEMAKITTYLFLISVISTWFLIIGGYSFLPFLNWINAIDYLLNVLCLYLMFRFVRFRQRMIIAARMNCIGSKYCCWCWCCFPFKYICWKNDVLDRMEAIFQSKSPTSSKADFSKSATAPKSIEESKGSAKSASFIQEEKDRMHQLQMEN